MKPVNNAPIFLASRQRAEDKDGINIYNFESGINAVARDPYPGKTRVHVCTYNGESKPSIVVNGFRDAVTEQEVEGIVYANVPFSFLVNLRDALTACIEQGY